MADTESSSRPIRVVVAGAKGRMGSETVRAVSDAAQSAGDIELVGATGRGDNLARVLAELRPDVLVDFTLPEVVMENIRASLAARVVPLVGATGLSNADLDKIARLCETHETACLVAPNFAIGAVLMMQFAQAAARYMPDAEIIEMHHERKKDAPSGTAQKTAQLIGEAQTQAAIGDAPGAFETAPGARGGRVNDVPVHSVRLPGFVASQEVIFGAPGQRLILRHDSIDRASFMPGVLLAIRRASQMRGLVYGLENLLT